jgi:hypothetical protein
LAAPARTTVEASRFRDEVRRRLRVEGMKRAAANDAAWSKMLEAFPPLVTVESAPPPPVAEQQANDVATAAQSVRLCDIGSRWIDDVEGRSLGEYAEEELGWWCDKYSVRLSDAARDSLVGIVVAFCRLLGAGVNRAESA